MKGVQYRSRGYQLIFKDFMIHRISFRNFFSFLEETEINFVVNKKAPDTTSYVEGAFEDRLTKLTAIVGPNASGKTNLLKFFGFIDWFVTSSFAEMEPDEEIPFKPFLFSSKEKPSSFSMDFEISKKLYRYQLETNTKMVFSERLSIKDEETRRFKSLFKRDWDSTKKKYSYDLKAFELPADFEQLIRPNASIIATANYVNHKASKEIIAYFKRSIRTNVFEAGRTMGVMRMASVVRYYDQDKESKAKAEEILCKFDLGISKILIDKRKDEDGDDFFTIKTPHKYIDKEGEYLLPFMYESSGTKKLFALLRIILEVLKEGGIAILDEIDVELHPSVLPEILELFTSKASNPKNAQLLFSTHNVPILNQLDKQQIMIVEKDDRNCSEAWSLNDMKVRSDDNYYTKYISGAYGGIPHFK